MLYIHNMYALKVLVALFSFVSCFVVAAATDNDNAPKSSFSFAHRGSFIPAEVP